MDYHYYYYSQYSDGQQLEAAYLKTIVFPTQVPLFSVTHITKHLLGFFIIVEALESEVRMVIAVSISNMQAAMITSIIVNPKLQINNVAGNGFTDVGYQVPDYNY